MRRRLQVVEKRLAALETEREALICERSKLVPELGGPDAPLLVFAKMMCSFRHLLRSFWS